MALGDVASFSGLASGIQWRDMIDQIIALESRPIQSLEAKISASQLRIDTWTAFRSGVQALNDAVLGLENGSKLSVFKATTTVAGGGVSPLASVSASSTAAPGSHVVDVLAVATNEKVGGAVFDSRTNALGLSGELRVNGKRIQIAASDTLDSIAQRFNAGGTGVTASVLTLGQNQYRLVLTSTTTGAAGIDLVDGADGLLQGLGFTDGTTSIKRATSSGALGDAFADSTSAVASLLGFTNAGAGTVTIGGEVVAIDLATDSLDTIALAINNAAIAAGKGFRASVVDDTVGGTAQKRLEIRGTTSFVDSNHVLEALGVVEAGRGAIAQVVQGAALTAGDATTPATAATALSSLWSGGVAAGVQAGDTLTISGTRGDGSAFNFTYTVGAGDTLQDILDRLNDPTDGLKAGTRTATASIGADGSIVVTDDAGGTSRLSLSIIAHNENGGALDFGAFTTTTAGMAREITAGVDAELTIDGAYFTSASNTVTDAVPGLTLSLSTVTGSPVTVNVGRDVDAAASSVKAVVDAYNALTDFVTKQLTPPPEGGIAAPLYGNNVLRSMRSSLRLALQGTVATDVANGLVRMQDIGVELQKDGRFSLDEAKLKAAIANDGGAVSRLLGLHGAADSAAIQYLRASDATKAGTYAIDITQAAAAADIIGVGFSGVYVDDGTPDTLTIRDLGTNRSYSVQLVNGMTTDQIVAALNAEFGTPQAHVIQAATALQSDAVGTVADEATTLASLHTGGAAAGVADGDTFTISGTRSDGSTFLTSFAVTDAATQTLGDLRSAVQAAVGSDVDVAFVNGQLTVTAKQTGSSLLTLAVTSDNAGGGNLSFGAFGVQTEGRGTVPITASNSGGQLRLTHAEYGSAEGFEVMFAAGGTDNTGSLGLAAGTFAGVDVAGTIGGIAATGSGRILTGAAGTAVEGLAVTYTGTTTGAVGNLTFSRGIASMLRLATAPLLSTGPGSIDAVTQGLDAGILRMNDRIAQLEDRLARHEADLIRRFTRLEELMSRAQTQSQWLASQLQALQPRQQNQG